MTVSELIETLKTHSGDTPVCLLASEEPDDDSPEYGRGWVILEYVMEGAQ